MKKMNYLLAAVSVLLASCNGEDASQLPGDGPGVMTLDRIERLVESPELYEKHIQYFENGQIVEQKTFDAAGNIVAHVDHEYTADSQTLLYYIGESLSGKQVFTYDEADRVTGIEVYDETNTVVSTTTVTYNTDGTITQIVENAGFETAEHHYSTNASGLIESMEAFVGSDMGWTSTLNYAGNKPVSIETAGADYESSLSFSYYDTAMPSNQVKTVNQINNSVFELGGINFLAANCNHYLHNTSDGSLGSDKTFNTLGYITEANYVNQNNTNYHFAYFYNEDAAPVE